MEVGQGPNWGCSAKEKKIYTKFPFNDRLKNSEPISSDSA
jgi:hypothetical protein